MGVLPETVRSQAMKALLAFLLVLAPSFSFSALVPAARSASSFAPLKPGDEIDFPRASGATLPIRVGAREPSPLGRPTFVAYVGDVAAATVIDADDEGLLVQMFEGFAGNARCVHQTVPRTAVRPAAAVPVEATRKAVPRVDVLVAYDRGARAFAEANGGITNFALAAVAKMNAVLVNTKIDTSFRYCLVGVMTVDASAKSVKEALDKAAAKDPPPDWEPIRAERERVGADVVSVLVNLGGVGAVTGAANGLRQTGGSPDVDPCFVLHADRAYCACSVHGVFEGQSMTHEVGHLLGAGHATALVGSHQDKRGPQLYKDSSGHYFTGAEDGQRYYTIMSYRSDGSDLVYVSAPFFSSPDYAFKGTDVGDGLHNNTATLMRTGPHAARWRKATVPSRDEVVFSHGTRSHFTESVCVSLSVGAGQAADEIRYTTDGSMPTLDSPRYIAPLVFRETTTLKAAAVIDGVFAPVCTAEYVRDGFGATIGAPNAVWSTSPDFPWALDDLGEARAVRSGDGGAMYSPPSELWTTVAGPVTVRFRYRTQCLDGYATFRVSVDGEALFEPEKDAVYKPAWQDVAVAIPEGTHELRFSFALEDGGRWPEDSLEIVYNGVWLTELEIPDAPRPPETDTPVRVPYVWIDQYPEILNAAGGDYEVAASSVGANGHTLWESYLAGLVPTNAQSKFLALIEMRDGKPVVTWTPDLGDERVYTVYGVRNLGEVWQKVTASPLGFRFFRVSVELKTRSQESCP